MVYSWFTYGLLTNHGDYGLYSPIGVINHLLAEMRLQVRPTSVSLFSMFFQHHVVKHGQPRFFLGGLEA